MTVALLRSFGRCQAWSATRQQLVLQQQQQQQHHCHTKRSCSLLSLSSASSDSTTSTPATTPTTPTLFPPNMARIMAPMVAASDYPFRCLMRQYGVQLTFTQMLHSKNLCRDRTFRSTHLDLMEFEFNTKDMDGSDTIIVDRKLLLPHQQLCLEGISEDGRYEALAHLAAKTRLHECLTGPVMAQVAGSTPETVIEAAKLVMDASNGQLSGIDLNLGCPQGIARKGHYGAFLMEADLDGVCAILAALTEFMAEQYPKKLVSAKIRLPSSDEELLDNRIPRLIETGISFLTIHGRTIKENKTNVRGCHLDRIKLAVDKCHAIQPGFPVVANGGVETYQDVLSLQQKTGAVAVMSSEALLETPNVFLQPARLTTTTHHDRAQQQFAFAKDYLDWCTIWPPLPGVLGDNGSFNIAKGHLFKFLYRYLQEQPDLRQQLGSHGKPDSIHNIQTARALIQELEARYAIISEADMETMASSRANASWYRRHRDALEERLVHSRDRLEGTATSPPSEMSVEDKKALLRKRISKLKEQRLMKS